MSIYVVPEVAWGNILDAFSRLHRGWLADVDGAEPAATPVRPRTWRPLAAVALGSPADAPVIRIDFTDGTSLNVAGPRELRLESREDGAEQALEIDRSTGTQVRLVFRATGLAEELDGIAPAEPRRRDRSPSRWRPRRGYLAS